MISGGKKDLTEHVPVAFGELDCVVETVVVEYECTRMLQQLRY